MNQKSNDRRDRIGPPAFWMDRTERRHLTHFARRPSRVECRREKAMRDWYGEDLAPGEILAHRSPPRLAGDIVDDALWLAGLGNRYQLDKVLALWPTLVGPELARRTQPRSVREGVLTVEVASASWLYVLEREHHATIRDRLREATGGTVTELRFEPPGRGVPPRTGRLPAGTDGGA